MRGRDFYRLAKPALLSIGWLLHCLPASASTLGMVLTKHLPTKIGIGVRFLFLQRLARQCGDCVAIFEGVHLYNLATASFGTNISIHPLCYIDATGGLTIGSDVSIAHNVTIMTTEHTFSDADLNTRDAPASAHPVVIGNDVWIGAGVRILAGVEIGDHVVVGAGAVVTKSIPSYSLVAGVPARKLKTIKAHTHEETQNGLVAAL